MSREVAKDGVVRIPKSVFVTAPEPAPAAAASSSASASSPSNGGITRVKRLDGTWEELVPPNNPAFGPRKTVFEGKVVTNDKLEVKLKFYERKGLALTPELQAKKAELEAEAAASGAVWDRLGGTSGKGELVGKGNKKGKKGKKGKGGGGGAAAAAAEEEEVVDADELARRAARAAKFGTAAAKPAAAGGKVVKLGGGGGGAVSEADAARTAAWKNRPKGGVRVLSGVEGGLTGGKRGAEEGAEPESKRAAA